MISDQQKRKAKERATAELKKLLAIAIYLWVLLSMFEIHRFAVLRNVSHASISPYRIGSAAIKALIFAKFILIGDAMHLGERFTQNRAVYSVLFKSVIFALFVIFCDVIEEVVVGLIHGTSIGASIPRVGWIFVRFFQNVPPSSSLDQVEIAMLDQILEPHSRSLSIGQILPSCGAASVDRPNQSSGGLEIPQTFPGSSIATPTSQ